jgi:hypothetical protein
MASDFFTEIALPVTTFLPPVFGNPSWCTASTQQPKLTKKAVHDFAVASEYALSDKNPFFQWILAITKSYNYGNGLFEAYQAYQKRSSRYPRRTSKDAKCHFCYG